jgi:hypothetical protein
MIVVYTIGTETLGNHSAIAFTSRRGGARFYSYADNKHSTVHWFKQFKSSDFAWPGGMAARIPIPTKNDGNFALDIDEDAISDAVNPRGYDNCANHVHSLLEDCGASAYADSLFVPFFLNPNSITDYALSIRAGIMKRFNSPGLIRWPKWDKPNFLVFFSGDPRYRIDGVKQLRTIAETRDDNAPWTEYQDPPKSPALPPRGTRAPRSGTLTSHQLIQHANALRGI